MRQSQRSFEFTADKDDTLDDVRVCHLIKSNRTQEVVVAGFKQTYLMKTWLPGNNLTSDLSKNKKSLYFRNISDDPIWSKSQELLFGRVNFDAVYILVLFLNIFSNANPYRL